MKLTDKTVKGITPPDKPYSYRWDDQLKGFGVRITDKGTKTFIYTYRTRSGRQRRIKIGRWPTWTVEAARRSARELALKVSQGQDPQADRQADREAPTMSDLAALYIEQHLPTKRPAPAKTDRYAIERLILPAIGQLKVAEVSRADITKIHRQLSEQTPYRANRILALLSVMFSLAINQGWIDRNRNPVTGLKRNQETARERYLTDDELSRLLSALADHHDQAAADAIRLLMLTGARRGEVLSMRWCDVDFDAGRWSKPAHTTKQKKTHHVPLSAPALSILARRQQMSTSTFVFPGRDGRGYRVDLKKPWSSICRQAGIDGLRLHDLRHSYASTLASAGLSLPIIGALLGHSQAATTQRYSHLIDEALRKATAKVGDVITSADHRRRKA
jgi:integrase